MPTEEFEYRKVLEKLRGHLAYSKQCAPYLVFGNDELELLLEAKPKTIKELSGLKGFPPEGKRVEKWGEAIIAVFNNPNKELEFEVESSPKEGEEPSVKAKLKLMNAFS